MSFVPLDEDKNSESRNLLEQSDDNSDKCFSQPKESSREIENKGGSIKLAPKFSTHQKNQPLPSQTQNRGTSKSPQRKNPGIFFPETNTLFRQGSDETKPKYERAKRSFKVENYFPSFTPALPVQQPVYFVQTSKPKFKLSELHGDPLERPKWCSLFTAPIHNAPIDENAKMNHLKTLVKGETKAGQRWSRVLRSDVKCCMKCVSCQFWTQSLVSAQMKQIHLNPFINSHDSVTNIKYDQLITTCVNVLKNNLASLGICI